MHRSDSALDVCCLLSIATDHAMYACKLVTAFAAQKAEMREACEQIFSCFLVSKTDMRL